MLPLALDVLVVAFVVNGVDASWGEATTAAVVQELSDEFVVATSSEPKRPGFVVEGALERVPAGVQVTVDVSTTEPRRRFGRTTVLVDHVEDAPAAARASARQLLVDPLGGWTPALTTGALVVLGGAVAVVLGGGGLFWNKEVLASPSSTAAERARATSLELPFLVAAGAGAAGVLTGASIIAGANLLDE